MDSLLLFISFIIAIIIIVWIILSSKKEPGRYIPEGTKQKVLERYFHMCAVCPETQLLEFHHKVPYSISKDNSEKNLCPLCPKHHAMVRRLNKNDED